ncbi:ESPR-type extended signal peptide-containing protein [Caballeronia insecticola]|uniref:ESPR-type extended signal peptide-containing protein n=1 Tax=Caballeronia insecticola TaxID=758793 RepID=UPI0005C5FBA9
MNKTYRSVWNESTGTWVAASEEAKGRGKGKSARSTVLLLAAFGAGGGALALSNGAFAATSNLGYGGLQLCPPGIGVNGTGIGYATSAVGNMLCQSGQAFSLNNAADPNGGQGFSNSTARVTGYTNGMVELKAVNGIRMLNFVDMSSQSIINLAAGVNATDAVNYSQLTNVGMRRARSTSMRTARV